MRIQTQNTAALFEFGRIDNLVVTAQLEDPNAFPPPQIVNLNVTTNGIIRISDGVRFVVSSGLSVAASNITAVLDGIDISPSLVVTGPGTNRSVSYNTLTAGNHTIEITARSAAGTTVLPQSFIATDEPWLVHPADGWVSGWQWASGTPELRTTGPIDGAGPYIRLDTLGGARNFMREYQTGAVDVTQPHYIRWKFRLIDADFASTFTAFNDRVHFFGRSGARLTASTDALDSWAISATGTEQAPGSGVSGGQTFYIYDNVDGTGAYNLGNLVNSAVQVFPDHVYSFELLVRPTDKTYSVSIVDNTSSASFTSSAPHRFRDLADTSHNFLHFGIQAAVGTTPRRSTSTPSP